MKKELVAILSIIFLSLNFNTARASYLLFDQPTDTIDVAGQLVIGTSLTYEARIFFTDSYNGNGYIFNEWTYGQEDKLLYASPNEFGGYNYRIAPSMTTIHANTTLSLGAAHHLAYVYDGSQERLYLDGQLLEFRSASGNVGDGSGNPHIGAIFRDASIRNSFIGYLDTVRVSDIVRYNSTEFDVPFGDLVADEHTLLLYNFNESPDSTTVIDQSGNGHDGTLGVGFSGATSPTFSAPVPVPSAVWLLGSGLAGLIGLKCKKNNLKSA